MPTDTKPPGVTAAAALSRRTRLAALADLAQLAPRHEVSQAVLRRLIEKHSRRLRTAREETT